LSDVLLSEGFASQTLAVTEAIKSTSVPLFAVAEHAGKTLPVVIPHMMSWQSVCFQALTDENSSNLKRVNKEITKQWESQSGKVSRPSVGDLLLAKDVDGAYYRAEVLSCDLSSGKCSVRFIDFGNETLANIADCLEATEALSKPHACIFTSEIKSTKYDLMSAAGADAIEKIKSEAQLMAQIDPNDVVHSLQTPDGQDFLEKLKIPLVNVPIKPKQPNLRSDQVPWSPFIPATNGKDCTILITDVQNFTRIHVQNLEPEFFAGESHDQADHNDK
jgi:hypothetical protein